MAFSITVLGIAMFASLAGLGATEQPPTEFPPDNGTMTKGGTTFLCPVSGGFLSSNGGKSEVSCTAEKRNRWEHFMIENKAGSEQQHIKNINCYIGLVSRDLPNWQLHCKLPVPGMLDHFKITTNPDGSQSIQCVNYYYVADHGNNKITCDGDMPAKKKCDVVAKEGTYNAMSGTQQITDYQNTNKSKTNSGGAKLTQLKKTQSSPKNKTEPTVPWPAVYNESRSELSINKPEQSACANDIQSGSRLPFQNGGLPNSAVTMDASLIQKDLNTIRKSGNPTGRICINID